MKASKSPFDLLEQIQPVEASPFLLTRIRQKIDTAVAGNFSPRLAWSLSLGFALLLAINTLVMVKNKPDNSAGGSLVQAMQLMPDNDLYK